MYILFKKVSPMLRELGRRAARSQDAESRNLLLDFLRDTVWKTFSVSYPVSFPQRVVLPHEQPQLQREPHLAYHSLLFTLHMSHLLLLLMLLMLLFLLILMLLLVDVLKVGDSHMSCLIRVRGRTEGLFF